MRSIACREWEVAAGRGCSGRARVAGFPEVKVVPVVRGRGSGPVREPAVLELQVVRPVPGLTRSSPASGDFMQKLSQLAISSEGFIFNPATGDSFQVSQTGLDVINGMRDGRGDEEIVAKLAETYEVAPEDARRDVADFRGTLRAFGLV